MPKFDVAFIGTGIAGLYAAAQLSKAGRQVILFDPAERAGGVAAAPELDGIKFIGGLNLGYGLEPAGRADAVYEGLGLPSDDLSTLSSYQVALPDRRITIAADVQETLSDLRREFPREIDKIQQLYRETLKMSQKAAKSGLSSYLLRRRTAGSYLRTRTISAELTAYFDIQSRFFFGQTLHTLPLSSLVLMLTHAPRSFPAGLTTVSDRLIASIEGHHGSIRLREPWPELAIQRRRVSGVRTAQGAIEARSVVVNAAWEPWEHTTFIALPAEAVPVSMEHTVLSLPDYARPDESIALTLSRADSSSGPDSMRTLTASFFGSALAVASPETRTGLIRTIMPFLFDFPVRTYEQGQGTPRYGLPKDMTVPSFDGKNAFPLPVVNTMKNLYLAPDLSRALHLSLSAGNYIAKKLR